MNQKIIAIVTPAAYERLQADPRLHGGHIVATSNAGTTAVAIYSQHANLRFELALEDGVIVLPGMHDPEPIGDVHKHLSHVDAQPHETMRAVALRLHVAHGPAFHPDT